MAKKMINRANELTFKALQKAIEEEKIQICLLTSQVNRPGSPIYNPWEVLLPILVPTLLGLLLIMLIGPITGLILMIALIFVSTHFIRKKLEARLLERARQFFLNSLENCEKMWDFGGIVLVNKQHKNQGCVAPEGDWKEFIIYNFADLMTEKKEETTKDEAA